MRICCPSRHGGTGEIHVVSHEFQVGKKYYVCELTVTKDGEFVPLVETWVYRGFVKRSCSSTSCEVPYHFYHFDRYPEHSGAENGKFIPSRRQAESSMLTWEQFLVELEEVKQEVVNERDKEGSISSGPCSFCGKQEIDVGALVEGPVGLFMCLQCAKSTLDSLDQNRRS